MVAQQQPEQPKQEHLHYHYLAINFLPKPLTFHSANQMQTKHYPSMVQHPDSQRPSAFLHGDTHYKPEKALSQTQVPDAFDHLHLLTAPMSHASLPRV